MKKLWKISVVLLAFACEPKKAAQLSAVTECNDHETKPTEASHETPSRGHDTKTAGDTPEPSMSLSAKVVPEPVHYDAEQVNANIFNNPTSREEAKDEDLKKIKEDALKRLQKRKAAVSLPEEESEVSADQSKGEALYVKARIQSNKGRYQSARDLYLASCQSGFSEGCHKFAWHEEKSGNRANAHQFYRQACEGGLGKSCNNLAFHFEQQKNWDKALDFYANACMKKHEPSCQNLKRLRDELNANR